MTIHERRGNVLDIPEGVIVHGCNCLGAMGSGIAKEIATRFPAVEQEYAKQHFDNGLVLGSIQLVKIASKKWIVNAMTQPAIGTGRGNMEYDDNVGGLLGDRAVSYDAVASCFAYIDDWYKHGVFTKTEPMLAFPRIGAGLGGGDWDILKVIIDKSTPNVPHKVCYIL